MHDDHPMKAYIVINVGSCWIQLDYSRLKILVDADILHDAGEISWCTAR